MEIEEDGVFDRIAVIVWPAAAYAKSHSFVQGNRRFVRCANLEVSLVRSAAFGAFQGGSAQAVGRALFTQFLLPFEVVSVLILIAILGAVVLAQKEMD